MMPVNTKFLDDDINSLVAEIDDAGVGVVRNFLSADELRALQVAVETAVDNAGGQYVEFTAGEIAATKLGAVSRSAEFLNLMHRVYERGSGYRAPKQSLFQVMRCLKGETGLKHSLRFHYDSYFVTALIPIIIPAGDQAGHLVMKPNHRKLRASYLHNLFDKILLDNRITQFVLKTAYNARRSGLKEVVLVPGNLYFFWGYRTLHANAACDPRHIRATALFHFGDPHADSQLRKLTGRAKQRATAHVDDELPDAVMTRSV